MKMQPILNVKKIFSIQKLTFAAALLIAVFGISTVIQAQAIRPSAISLNSSGNGTGNSGLSQRASVSADGRFVVFQSEATNLVNGLTDTNNNSDVFLRDNWTNQTRCLSAAISGNTTGDGGSYQPIITPDGAYVIFASFATNIIANDTNNKADVFRYHVGSGALVMVSRNHDNQAGGNDNSFFDFGEYKPYDISDDGRYVVFVSSASDLLPEPFLDNNSKLDVFVRDIETNTTRCASISTTLASTPNDDSYDVSISADGKRVSFVSEATNLVDNLIDPAETRDIFIRDMPSNEIRCATHGYGADRNRAWGGDGAVMSKNGARIIYYSISAQLAPNDTLNNIRDAFVYDFGLDTVFLLSVNPAGTSNGNDQSGEAQSPDSFTLSITPDGRFAVFESRATNLVTGIIDTNTVSDVFRRDLQNGVTKMVSVNTSQTSAGSGRSTNGKKAASISPDGRFITFLSQSSNLIVEGFGIGNAQPFFRDMNNNITFAASLALSGISIDGGASFKPAISANGKNVVFESVAGSLTPNDTNGTIDVFRTRLASPQQNISDFDGDGRTDFAIFRPSNGIWYSLPANGFVNIRSWGQNGDRIVPADYDGDGKTDHAIFRDSEGKWYIQKSIGIVSEIISYGLPGDIPVPADYDGDNQTDVAVFRPSNGVWYILQSSNGQTRFENFGLNGDLPVIGDYDGDSRSDVAVFRPSANTWYILKSGTNSFVSLQFGLSGDKLAPADYDGDGKTDIAVFRPSDRLWYIFQSRNNETQIINFGLSNDIPVPNDYDGDGKADISVFRPSSGDWFVLQSSNNNLTGANWGLTGDVPVPSAYIP